MEEASSSNSGTCTATWSREEEKDFENAVATHGDNWDEIAALVPSKTLDEIKRHYDLLVEDINGIEAGRVQLPPYTSGLESGDHAEGGGGGKKGGGGDSGHGGKGSRSEQERRKGIAWTEDEHRYATNFVNSIFFFFYMWVYCFIDYKEGYVIIGLIC